MKKSSLAEMRKQYMEKPTAETTIEIDGIAYTVISHYVGSNEEKIPCHVNSYDLCRSSVASIYSVTSLTLHKD